MRAFSWSRFSLAWIFFLLFSSLILFGLKWFFSDTEQNSFKDQNPFMVIITPENESTSYFRLVDARLLDDNMLEVISPESIPPLPAQILRNEHGQIIKQ